MNLCCPVQKICNKLCHKQRAIKYMAPVNKANCKVGEEKLNKKEEEKTSIYQENPKQPTEKVEKNISGSYDDSLYDDFPEFTIRRGQTDNNNNRIRRNRSSSTSYSQLLQRNKRGTNSIFGTQYQQTQKKAISFESNVKNKTPNLPAPKKRTKTFNDPVEDQWANKGALVYSAQTVNPSKPKSNKYWVQTELQYILLLPTDKPKTKPPSEPLSEEEPLPTIQDKENFDDLDSFYSDSDSFIARSEAKPAPKPKGRFCCAKRQTSE